MARFATRQKMPPPRPPSMPGQDERTVSARLVLSVAEAAGALGVSDDLVYQLLQRGELPCIRSADGR